MIIWQSIFNQLGVALSHLYLCRKYPPSNGQVGFIKGDQEIFKKCYVGSLKLKMARTLIANTKKMDLGIKPPEEACKSKENEN